MPLGSDPAKPNVAERLALGLGGKPWSPVSGGAVSTVHVKESGVGATFPAGSIDLTVKVCVPSPTPV
jgi:hypothetical protein